MKNKIILLFLLLLIPFIVNAETCDNNKVRIKSISIENIKGKTIEKKDANVEDKNINLDLSMSDVGDSITYKIEVENLSSEDYEIDNTNIKSKSRYIKYSFINNNSLTVGAGQTKVLYLMAKYDTEVPATALVNDTYTDTEDIVVNLSSYTNPKTGSNVMFMITMGLLLSVVVYFYFKQDYKIPTMVIILSLIIIPITAKAACKLSINIKSNVEITKIAEFDTGNTVNHKVKEMIGYIYEGEPIAEVGVPQIGSSIKALESFKRSNTLPEDIKNIVNEQLNEAKNVTVSDEEVDGVLNHYNSQESLDNTITDAVIETINGKTEICNQETNECLQKEEIIEYFIHNIPFIKIVEYGSNEVKYVIYDETADDIKVVDTNEVKKELEEYVLLSKKTMVLKNVFSSNKSDYLIYGWFNEEDKTLYYYCEKEVIYLNEDSSSMFSGLRYLKSIPEMKKFNTSKVMSTAHMFSDTANEYDTFDVNFSNFDTSNVKDMSYMFSGFGSNFSSFNLDLSHFDTSNVTDMSCMFRSAGSNSTVFSPNLSSFNTSNVTNMRSMFNRAGLNSTTYNLDFSNWDTSKVTDMSYMFYNAGGKVQDFNLDLSSFNTSNVVTMTSMFMNAGTNSKKVNLNVSTWNTSNVKDMSLMFDSMGFYSEEINLDLSSWNTSNVTTMWQMFSNMGHEVKNFKLDLSNWNTSSVTNMSNMFSQAGVHSETFSIGDLSSWDTSKVTGMSSMFNLAGSNAEWESIGTLNIYADSIRGIFERASGAKVMLNIHKKPETYNDAFYGAATKDDASIVVNYKLEVDNINNIISTKSTTSHVTKGECIDGDL